MDRIFLDTDVAIDILSKRDPFFEQSVKLIEYSNEKPAILCISEGCIYNMIYLAYDSLKINNSDRALSLFISKCEVLQSNKQILLSAIQSSFKDKEDACQYYTAQHNLVNFFITRHKKDYSPYSSSIPVYTPTEFLEIFNYQ